jgi:hypothetical protein
MMEETKYNFIADDNECSICYEDFNESFKCKRCTSYAVQNGLIVFIFLIIIIVIFADIKNNLIYYILEWMVVVYL